MNKKLKGYPIGTDVRDIILKEFTYYNLTKEQFNRMTTEKGIGFSSLGFKISQNVIGVYIPEKQETHKAYNYFILQYHWLITILYHMGVYSSKEYDDILNNTSDVYVVLYHDNTKSKTDKKMFETKVCIPTVAMAKFQSKLREYDVDINKRLNQHQNDIVSPIRENPFDYDGDHFKEDNMVFHYRDCIYVDINKTYAHGLQLCFPELNNWIQKQYDIMTPETKAYTKSFFNYVVGMMENENWYNKQLTPEKWRRCRWRIVEWCNKQIEEASHKLNGNRIYCHTDGMIIHKPKGHIVTDQKKLGAFKKETMDNDEIWFVSVNEPGYAKYKIMQWFENGKKVIRVIGGYQQNQNLLDHTDLSKGIIPLFTESQIGGCRVVEYIKEMKLNEKEG